MYEDTKEFIRRCILCQKYENINARDAMPLTTNLQLELFDVWAIDYKGPFPKSQHCEYILWQSTTFQNGLKLYHVELQIPITPRGCF
jgi:hypothetical protein